MRCLPQDCPTDACGLPLDDGVRRCRSRTQSPKSPAPQVMDAPVLGEEDELMERRTLNQITNRTRRGDLVFYYHSKGVSSRRVNQEPGARRPCGCPGVVIA